LFIAGRHSHVYFGIIWQHIGTVPQVAVVIIYYTLLWNSPKHKNWINCFYFNIRSPRL